MENRSIFAELFQHAAILFSTPLQIDEQIDNAKDTSLQRNIFNNEKSCTTRPKQSRIFPTLLCFGPERLGGNRTGSARSLCHKMQHAVFDKFFCWAQYWLSLQRWRWDKLSIRAHF